MLTEWVAGCYRNRWPNGSGISNCQKEIVKVCVDQGGNYLLPVKGNQGNLHKQIAAVAEDLWEKCPKPESGFHYAETRETGHGRKELRMGWVIEDLSDIPDARKWQGLQQVGMIQRDRQIGNKVSTEVHYYIMSQQHSAAELLDIARKHWEVESVPQAHKLAA